MINLQTVLWGKLILGLGLILDVHLASAAGISDDEARSLTADMVLMKFESGVKTCETLGASNLPALYDAMRQLSQLRAELVPSVDSKLIHDAKVSYQRGMAALPVPEVTARDQIALICDRTLEKIQGMAPESLLRIVDSGAKNYQQLFARAE